MKLERRRINWECKTVDVKFISNCIVN